MSVRTVAGDELCCSSTFSTRTPLFGSDEKHPGNAAASAQTKKLLPIDRTHHDDRPRTRTNTRTMSGKGFTTSALGVVKEARTR